MSRSERGHVLASAPGTCSGCHCRIDEALSVLLDELPEGSVPIRTELLGDGGVLASRAVTLVVDRSAPKLSLSGPLLEATARRFQGRCGRSRSQRRCERRGPGAVGVAKIEVSVNDAESEQPPFVVIGNPPYFSVDATCGAGHPVPAYLKTASADTWLDKTDIYYYFLRKAAGLARQRLGFIVSRALLEADKARRVRGWLAENARLERLLDFDGFLVFADAGIATTITVFDTQQEHGAAGGALAARMDADGGARPGSVPKVRAKTLGFAPSSRFLMLAAAEAS